MKKFYLGALGCLLAMGASAQTFEPVGTLNSYGIFYTIPSALAFNGESCPYSGSKSEDGNEIHLYNKSFGIERTINVKNPTSYSRLETETRKAVTKKSTEKTTDCCEYTFDAWGDPIYLNYRDYYAEYCCENTVYTDKYVYEWLEYMKGIGYFEGMTILERREVDGGSLFVTGEDEDGIAGFYFKENELSLCRKDYENEYWYSEEYGGFCYSKAYTDEYVYEWIEYMKEQNPEEFEGITILGKREVDGRSLFVTRDDEEVLAGIYTDLDHSKYATHWYEYNVHDDEVYVDEYWYENEYYDFCYSKAYTDEYVYEWIEYMNGIGHFDGMTILERREVDDGSFFVIGEDEDGIAGFYFKDNQLFLHIENYYEYHYSDDYYKFYNRKNAVFTEEYIREYINDSGEYGENFGLGQGSRWYYVESTSVTSTGETYFYTNLRTEIDGESVPVLYFVWKDESIMVHYIECTTSYTGEWVKTTENYSDDSGLEGFSVQIIGSAVDAEDTYCIATQTLFNNDAKWEFLRKVYEEYIEENSWETCEEDRDGDGEIDYKRTRYRNKVKGYEIVSEDGTVLATIDAPLSDDNSVNLLLWGEDAFLALTTWEYMEENDTEHLTTIYSIDKTTTRVTKVASAPTMRVSPTIANRNSTVNVTLGGETAKNGGELIITDSNGRTIGRSRVEAGQTNVPVTTNRMGSGVYNITLTEKGQKIDNARIIVK